MLSFMLSKLCLEKCVAGFKCSLKASEWCQLLLTLPVAESKGREDPILLSCKWLEPKATRVGSISDKELASSLYVGFRVEKSAW